MFFHGNKYHLNVCYLCCVCIIRNNNDTILQYTDIYYTKTKIATLFGCTRQPVQALCFRNVKGKLHSCSYVYFQLGLLCDLV